jgi:ferredoxin
MPKITIKVIPDLCIGAASCVTVAPDYYRLNEENKAYVLDHGKEEGDPVYERTVEVSEDEKENIILSAQSCPTLAVLILDEDGKQIFPEN